MYFRATYINKNAMASYYNDHKKGNQVVKNRHGFHSIPSFITTLALDL